MKRSVTFAALLALCLVPSVVHGQSAMLLQKPVVAGNCTTTVTSGTLTLAGDSGVYCSGKQIVLHDTGAAGMTLQPNYAAGGGPGVVLNQASKPLTISKTGGAGATSTDVADVMIPRAANYTGGTTGWVNGNLRLLDTVSAGSRAFEWALTSIMDNSGTVADGSENVAIYGQAHKRGTGATWATTFELQDHVANPVSSSVTTEFDLQAKGADSVGAGGRVINDLWGKSDDGAAAGISFGLRVNTDAHTTISHGLYLNGSFIDGLNLAGSTYGNAALILGDSQKLCVDSGACGNYLTRTGGVLYYHSSSGNLFSWTDTGQFTANSLNSTSGDVTFGGLTSAYPMLHRNSANLEIKKADASGYAPVIFDYAVSNGGRYCLDITCVRSWWVQGGVLYYNTGSGNVASITDAGQVTGSSLNTTGAVTGGSFSSGGNASVANVILPTNGKVCLNGAGCSVYLSYNGTTINLVGTTVATNTLSVASSGGMVVDITPGVTCTGTPTSGFRSVKGVVIAC